MADYRHHWVDGKAIDLSCSKVVCVGKNYADHIAEMNSATPTQPVLFIKPPSAVCDANQPIRVGHLAHLGELHHELEIALLIGHDLSSLDEDVTAAICGVGLGIDLTLRDVQSKLKKQRLPWERAKAFDGSCVLSAFINVSRKDNAESGDLRQMNFADIELELIVNDQTRQRGNSAMMLNTIPAVLAEIVQVFSLQAGDVVLTGTPAGVGPLKVNDRISGLLNGRSLISDTIVI